MLWPYRRSALKNAQRWTFGGVYPRAHAEARAAGDDPWTMQTQCLVEGDGATRRRRRACASCTSSGARRSTPTGATVDELDAGGERHLTWEEAVEREVALAPAPLGELAGGRRRADRDPRRARARSRSGPRARSCARWEALEGGCASAAEPARPGAAPDDRADREHDAVGRRPARGGAAARRSARRTPCCGRAGGAFVSLTDPPPALRGGRRGVRERGHVAGARRRAGRRATRCCRRRSSSRTIRGSRRRARATSSTAARSTSCSSSTSSASPTQEKAEMRASDPRAREILDRTEALSPEELMRLHGRTVRELAGARDELARLGRPRGAARRARSRSTASHVGRGSLVRLRPRRARRRLRPRARRRRRRSSSRIQQDIEGGVQPRGGARGGPGPRPRRRAPARAPLLLRARARSSRSARRRDRARARPDRGHRQRVPRPTTASASRSPGCWPQRELPAGRQGRRLRHPRDGPRLRAAGGLRRRRARRRGPARRGAGDAVRHRARARRRRSASLDAHAMDPVRVLGLARTLGTLPPRVLVVGCEPARAHAPGRRGARDGAQRARARRRRGERWSSSRRCSRTCGPSRNGEDEA